MMKLNYGFYLAALYNSFIIVFSKGFGEELGKIDPLFSSEGSFLILLWGALYLSLAHAYEVTPAALLVLSVEKAFYGIHWLRWLSVHANKLPSMLGQDPLVGLFYCIYGAGDLLFMMFFAAVAWKYRQNLFGEKQSKQS